LAELGKAQPVAAVDANEAHLAIAHEHLKLPSERLYTNMEEAFGSHAADFAIVVVPPAFHESVVDVALAHGLHILSEKPIADSMEACVRIYRKVKAAGRKMAVTMSHRFDQDKRTLEAAIKSGDYGDLSYLVHRFTDSRRTFASWGKFRHEMADPMLVEGSVHHFDILRALAGSNAATVYAQAWNPPWGEYAGDSTALVTVTMENGVRCLYEGATANACTLNGWGADYVRAECDRATLELDNRKLRALTGSPDAAPTAVELPLLERPVWMNAWLAEMFCDWLNGGPPPPTRLEDNLQCAALLFAALESVRTGAVVDVQGFLERHLEA
jgi:predicted dehydrogenase